MANLEEIQEKCLKTYQRNLIYFKNYKPEIYNKLVIFDEAVNQGLYVENYSLEYKEEGYFDILNLKSNQFYYNQNLEEYTDKLASIEKKDLKNSFRLVEKINVPANYKKLKDLDQIYLYSLFPLMYYINSNTVETKENISVYKYIFFGTGLGVHIQKIVNKINPLQVLIMEPNLEIFKLSLFISDYTQLVSTPEYLFLSVGDDRSDFAKIFSLFHGDNFHLNTNIKFNLHEENYRIYFDDVLNFIEEKKASSFGHDIILETAQRTAQRFCENFKFLEYFIDHTPRFKLFEEYPVIIVAPGPSLGKNIKWLKENQDKFLICAVGAALKILFDNGIEVDYITSVDPYEMIDNQFKGVDESFYKDKIFLCTSNTHPKILSYFKKENIYLFPVIGTFTPDLNFALGGLSVGDVTYALNLLIGAQKIFLLGLDSAFDQETGATHVEGHLEKRDILSRDESKIISEDGQVHTIAKDDKLEVKGNLRDRVLTTRNYKNTIEHFNRHNELFLKEQKVYNLSDGAYYEKTIPLDVKNFNSLDFKDIEKNKVFGQMKTFLDGISFDKLDQKSIKNLQNDLKHIDEFLKYITKQKGKKFANYVELDAVIIKNIHNAIDLCSHNLKTSSTIFAEALFKLLLFVYPSVTDFFNRSSKLRNDKKHATAIHFYITDLLIKILKDYKKILEELLKN